MGAILIEKTSYPPRESAIGEAAASQLSQKVRSLKLDDNVTADRTSFAWLIWLIAIGMLAGGGYAGWKVWSGRADGGPTASSKRSASSDDAGDAAADSPSTTKRRSAAGSASANTGGSASTDKIAAPVASAGDVALEAKGYIVPAHQILVSPKVNGMILRLFVEEGKRVTKGDVLAELESIDYQADLHRATAFRAAARQRVLELERGNRPEEKAQAEAELAEAEAQRDQLYSAFKRAGALRSNKVQSENEYEQAESAYKAMDRRVVKLQNSLKLMMIGARQERIEIARAELAQAEAELTKAQWRLDNCTIRAPVTGTILKKNAEEGNIVNPIAFNGSFSLCDMADLSDLEVDLSIQERDVAKVHKGQECKVRPEAFNQRVYDGVVSRLMPIADRAKGAIPVRVKVQVPADEEGVYLKPEMGVIVTFLKTDAPADTRQTRDRNAEAENAREKDVTAEVAEERREDYEEKN